MSVENKVKKIISKPLHIDIDKVTPEAFIEDDLGADSLDCVEIIMSMEEEFLIDIDDEEAEKIKTVQDAIDCINRS